MRKFAFVFILLILFSGCSTAADTPQITATTLPVYEFTTALCQDTDITVSQLVTDNVSCLHDYTLQVDQMRMIEGAEIVILSGAGLEAFLEDALSSAEAVIDASEGIHQHHAEHSHHDNREHGHENDPHIWLSPENAKIMACNIYAGLCKAYPEYTCVFTNNLDNLLIALDTLDAYGKQELSALSCRNLITFHDGFAYFAESFDLTILRAVEEESGSEASASELKELISLVEAHHLPAVFTERNGSASAAGVISAETGTAVYALDMAMSGNSYFEAMYHNIDTIKEALG